MIRKERRDGIVVSVGGQTALNVGLELHRSGLLEELGVRVLGTPIETIVVTEDRELFDAELRKLGQASARSLGK